MGDGLRWQDSPAVAGGFVLPGTVPVAAGPVHSVAARVAAPHRTRFDFIGFAGLRAALSDRDILFAGVSLNKLLNLCVARAIAFRIGLTYI